MTTVDQERRPLLADQQQRRHPQPNSEVNNTSDIDVSQADNSNNDNTSATITVSTPLLSPVAALPSQRRNGLSTLEICCICSTKFLDTAANVCVFPFINQMLHDTGNVPLQDLGYYSGLIDSLYSLLETLLSVFWGRLADRYGRKPIMIICMLGMGCTTLAFGFSSRLWQIILLRCLGGLFGGASVCAATMLTEKTTLETRGTAFALYGSANNVALAIAPLIGGVLANPAQQWPTIRFFRLPFFLAYPYAGPGIVIGAICLVTTIVFKINVSETLMSHGHRRAASESHHSIPRPSKFTIRTLLSYPPLRITFTLLTLSSILGAAIQVMVPLYLYTSPTLGGLGLSPALISLRYLAVGCIQTIWSLFIFQAMEHRYGVNFVMKIASHVWPCYCITFPVFGLMLRKGFSRQLVYSLFGFTTCFMTFGWLQFVSIGMIVNNASPSSRCLGTVNGIAGTLRGAMNATMPWLFTSIYAFSVSTQILGGYLAFAVLFSFSIPALTMTYFLPPDGHEKKVKVADTVD